MWLNGELCSLSHATGRINATSHTCKSLFIMSINKLPTLFTKILQRMLDLELTPASRLHLKLKNIQIQGTWS